MSSNANNVLSKPFKNVSLINKSFNMYAKTKKLKQQFLNHDFIKRIINIKQDAKTINNLFANKEDITYTLISAGKTGSKALVYLVSYKYGDDTQYCIFKLGKYKQINHEDVYKNMEEFSMLIDLFTFAQVDLLFNDNNMPINIYVNNSHQQEEFVYRYVSEAMRLKICPHFINGLYFKDNLDGVNSAILDNKLSINHKKLELLYIIINESAPNILTLNDFFDNNKLLDDFTEHECRALLSNIIFQLAYTLLCMKNIKLLHNDLHLGNILIFSDSENIRDIVNKHLNYHKNMHENRRYIKYRIDYNDYYLPYLGLTLKIFDFDRSIIFDVNIDDIHENNTIERKHIISYNLISLDGNSDINDKDIIFFAKVLDETQFADSFKIFTGIIRAVNKLVISSLPKHKHLNVMQELCMLWILNNDVFDNTLYKNFIDNKYEIYKYNDLINIAYEDILDQLPPEIDKNNLKVFASDKSLAFLNPYLYVYNNDVELCYIKFYEQFIFHSTEQILINAYDMCFNSIFGDNDIPIMAIPKNDLVLGNYTLSEKQINKLINKPFKITIDERYIKQNDVNTNVNTKNKNN